LPLKANAPVYQVALQLNQITAPLFLAVPVTVYQEFFREQIIQKTLEKIKPNLVVIDLEKEEITQWKTF
jgi:hypothetical protein